MARRIGRRQIRNVFGVPPSAVPREVPLRRSRPARVDPFDIDAVRARPKPSPPRRRRSP